MMDFVLRYVIDALLGGLVALLFGVVYYGWQAITRKKTQQAKTPNKRPISGPCPKCGAEERHWCMETCTYIDPLDYR